MFYEDEGRNLRNNIGQKLFVDEACGVLDEHDDECNGREQHLNGQVVGTRVNEAGLNVTKDDGREDRGAQQIDRDEKVMGKRERDKFEEWDDD
jgi:hypothetical protein